MTALIDDRHGLDRPELEHRLRQLALWYRELAERTANPAIWEARLQTAERLAREAERLAEDSKRS
jgi:hypothetical protein